MYVIRESASFDVSSESFSSVRFVFKFAFLFLCLSQLSSCCENIKHETSPRRQEVALSQPQPPSLPPAHKSPLRPEPGSPGPLGPHFATVVPVPYISRVRPAARASSPLCHPSSPFLLYAYSMSYIVEGETRDAAAASVPPINNRSARR